MRAENALEAKVMAANSCRDFANRLFPRMKNLFEPFIGQQIFKMDGPLMAKFQKLVDTLDLPNTVDLQVYRHVSDYSLAWTVKSCAHTNGHAYYDYVTVYVGDVEQRVLKAMCTAPEFRTDYTAEKVREARKRVEKAKKELSDANGELFPFGEYDN